MLRDPELVTAAGLADLYGTGHDQLTDISDSYTKETQALEVAILDQLRSYEQDNLTADEQLSYDIYEWYLADQVSQHRFMYHDYPATFFLTSVHKQLLNLFTELHPITGLQDAQDYVSRLSQVDIKIEQLIDGLEIREALGIVPPRFVFQWTTPEIRRIANSSATDTPFYTAFAEKLTAVDSLSTAEKEQLLDAAVQEIEASVLPAFQSLQDALTELQQVATTDAGVWKLPDGDAYYAHSLRHFTTTELSATEIHALGMAELEAVQAEMRGRFDELGYPQNESLTQLFGRVASEGGTLRGDAILAEYEAIITRAEQMVSPAFDLLPQADVVVIGVPQGNYYIPPAMDGSRPGAFYASVSYPVPTFSMATLAYHEAIPGHHFQLAITQELSGLPSFRNGITYTAYSEGWALYAEKLAAELDFYQDDPYGDLGRLQAEAFRAARLVVDSGIHAEGWTFDEAVAFMVENTGLPRNIVEGEVARYIVWPGQAAAYKIGMIKILGLREQASRELGAAYDIKAFHNAILSKGGMPLAILEQSVVRDLGLGE